MHWIAAMPHMCALYREAHSSVDALDDHADNDILIVMLNAYNFFYLIQYF